MVLWRPILDGLAAGLSSTVQSNSAGVGHIVQRGSALTLRAILLRHKDVFSPLQWLTILSKVVLPAINDAARNDTTPVSQLISESPLSSEVNFICGSLDPPPKHDDKQLQDYAVEAQAQGGAPLRPFGNAELLVEATFADLRQGGDGNLGRSNDFSNRKPNDDDDHPFPDSWIATTAGISLGLLVDIVRDVIFDMHNTDIREKIWFLIHDHFQNWIVGAVESSNTVLSHTYDDTKLNDDFSALTHSEDGQEPWQPSEALVRLGSEEFIRLAKHLSMSVLSPENSTFWWNTIVSSIVKYIQLLLEKHKCIKLNLIKTKLEEVEKYKSGGIKTIYGNASLVEERNMRDEDTDIFALRVLKLEWGATLYEPLIYGFDFDDNETIYLKRFVPKLKLNAIAAFCITTDIIKSGCMTNDFLTKTSSKIVKQFFDSLSASCELSRASYSDKDLAHAFSEYKRLEWGDSLQEVEMFLKDMRGFPIECQRGGNGSFYLPQEAMSTRAVLYFLSQMFFTRDGNLSWNSAEYAEPLLLKYTCRVLDQYVQSESNFRSLLKTKPWTDSSTNYNQVALYCTFFSEVVIDILNITRKFERTTLQKYMKELFPLLCDLINAQNAEIRQLVSKIMKEHVGEIILP